MSVKPTQNQALVSRILTFSCVDGPGNRLVVFLQGAISIASLAITRTPSITAHIAVIV